MYKWWYDDLFLSLKLQSAMYRLAMISQTSSDTRSQYIYCTMIRMQFSTFGYWSFFLSLLHRISFYALVVVVVVVNIFNRLIGRFCLYFRYIFDIYSPLNVFMSLTSLVCSFHHLEFRRLKYCQRKIIVVHLKYKQILYFYWLLFVVFFRLLLINSSHHSFMLFFLGSHTFFALSLSFSVYFFYLV